jgi:hypothetical protein
MEFMPEDPGVTSELGFVISHQLSALLRKELRRPHLRLIDHTKNGLVIAQGCNIPDTAAEFDFVN